MGHLDIIGQPVGRREDRRFLADSPSPLNPLHVKGTGEGSAVPGPAAIANAVADAPGVELTECPARAEMLVRLEA